MNHQLDPDALRPAPPSSGPAGWPVSTLLLWAGMLVVGALSLWMIWGSLDVSRADGAQAPKQTRQDVVESVGDGLAEALQRAAQERTAEQRAQAGTAGAGGSGPAWRLRCDDSANATTCRMNQELFLQRQVEGEQRTLGRLLNLTVLYLESGGERVPFMSLQMPLGVDLRPGAVMRVDDGPETPLEFLRCTESGCDASAHITPELLQQMRAGNRLRVGFRPWGSEQVTAVDASLIGFTAAFAELR